MRTKKLKWNTISSLLLQLTTIICGFILPRLILKSYGSEVNGLVNSIMQFLSMIAFLDMGVGVVVQSALYKPLAEKENAAVSRIVTSADRFFKKLAGILAVYILFLMIFYPYLTDGDFGHAYTAGLIFSIGISSFAQYYFGMVNGLLLVADQRGYIQYFIQLVTLVTNTVVSVLLITYGYSIQTVKFTASVLYLFRPVLLKLYVDSHYEINRKMSYEEEPIPQKWNGISQHICAIVIDGTDSVVLTLFAALSDVSVYSVYHLVIMGVKQLFISTTRGVQSFIGELWAKQETEELKKFYGMFEWLMHTGVVLVFGCTGALIVPFVQVYTKGISDVNYIQPLFGVLLTMANAGHCLRLPYNVMILAGGHYKQAQSSYIAAAVMNVVISVVTVRAWGLVGVTLGTLAAMMYQTVWQAWYNSKHLLQWEFKSFVKHIAVDIVSVLAAGLCSKHMIMNGNDFSSWFVLAIKVAAVWTAVIAAVNIIFYRKYMTRVAKHIRIYVKR